MSVPKRARDTRHSRLAAYRAHGSNTTARTSPGSSSSLECRTVQGELEAALARLSEGSAQPVDGAGRTDAGVHAHGAGDRVHLAGRLSVDELGRALDALLPPDVAIRDLRRAPAGSTLAMRRGTGSTATPSGTGRAARSASAPRSGCGSRSIPPRWRGPGRPSWAGTTSAPSGRRTGSRSGPFIAVRVRRAGPLVTIDVRADAFLREMVRRIVAVLLEVGRGTTGRSGGRRGTRRPATGPRTGPSPRPGALCLRRVVLGTADGDEQTETTRNR